MEQIYLIENFNDLVKAFKGSRDGEDPVPMMETGAKLLIGLEDESLQIIGSRRFILADKLRNQSKQFVNYCVAHQISQGSFECSMLDD